MRLLMLGNGPFAVPTLRALARSAHDVALVVARPPRGRARAASPMQQAAESLGIDSWAPDSVNLPESQARLASLQGDLLVVCDYGEILRSETLATTRLGGVNLHGSLLPKFRGAAPVQWAILRGETETGNSVIQMTPGLDAGPCLGQQRTPIEPDEDAAALEARLAEMGAELVLQVVGQLANGTATPIDQDTSQASKAPRLKKEQGAIDWSHSAAEIKNFVRALRPWPRAYTHWHRGAGSDGGDAAPLRLNVDRVAVVRAELSIAATVKESSAAGAYPAQSPPGTVLDVMNRLVVLTGSGALEILDLQAAGKRAMSAADFLRGNPVAIGDRFRPE